jgi:hypothetical protein
MNEKPSVQYIRAAQEYAQTGSVRKSAREAKVAESTLQNWKRDEEFQKLVGLFREVFLKEVISGIVSGARDAIARLIFLLKSKDETVCLKSAELLLEYFERLSEEQKMFKGPGIGFNPDQVEFDIVKAVEQAEDKKNSGGVSQ